MNKEAKVIMLPTKDKTGLVKVIAPKEKWESLFIDATKEIESGAAHQNYHLYLVSDEEIKVGDWTINVNCKYEHGELTTIDNEIELREYASQPQIKKVIATTDKSLGHVSYDGIDKGMIPVHTPHFVPQIQQSFIEDYVKAEGKIDEVMVEYDAMPADRAPNGWDVWLKTRDDNTIIIVKK